MYRVGPSLLVPGELGLLALRPLPRGTVLFPLAAAPAAAMNDADLRMTPLRAARDAAALERALDDARARYAHSRLSNCAERNETVVVTASGVAAGAELTRRYGWHRWLVELGAASSFLSVATFPGFAWHVARHVREAEEDWAAAVVPRLPAWLERVREEEKEAGEANVRICWDRESGRATLQVGERDMD